MTRKKETAEERANRIFGYHCGIINLPFRLDELPPEIQKLFHEVAPLPLMKIEDMKFWTPVKKMSAISTLQEYGEQDRGEISKIIEDNPIFESFEPEIEGFLKKLKEALEK